MFIRIGFETILECTSPTPLLLALLPHPSYGGQMVGSDQVRTDPEVPQEGYLDEFANRRVRTDEVVGTTTDAERLALLENLPDAPALTLDSTRGSKSGVNRCQIHVAEESCI